MLGIKSIFHLSLFWGYILLFAVYDLLNYNVAVKKIYYNTNIVVLAASILKITTSIYFFLKNDGDIYMLYKSILENKKCLYLYIIPSGLYVLYDNLAIINMQTFDPATYGVLSQVILFLFLYYFTLFIIYNYS